MSQNGETMEEQIRNLRVSDADLQQEFQSAPTNNENDGGDENHRHYHAGPKPFRFIPLRMGGNGGTHLTSPECIAMMREEVSLADLKAMTTKFYENAFQDVTLDALIRSHDDPHGARFAKWIHQKLSGSNVWDKDRKSRDLTPVVVAGGRTAVVHDRSSAHAAAWYSPKRPRNEVGRHFKLDECRVWMRLHFWAVRESGMMEKSPTFADFYLRFIGHFVRVYEAAAPQFARDSFRWSANPKNIEQYIKNGRHMKDVLGLNFQQSINTIPESEFNDMEWPYNQTMSTDSESDSE